MNHWMTMAVGLFALGTAGTAHAATDAELQDALETMQQQLSTQQQQIQELKDRLAKQQTAPIAVAKDDAATVRLKPGPEITSADGKTVFALDGRVTMDAGWVGNDDADLGDAADIRYLWLGTKGKVGDWGYRLLAGLENDSTDIKDAFVSYHGFNNVMLQAGNFKEFNGIENMSSNLHNTFLERSSGVSTFRPLRRLGVGGTVNGERWTLQVGAFGDDTGNTAADDEGYSYTGRLFAAPILDAANNHVLHVGGAVRYQVPDADDDSIRYRSRGESHVIDAQLVDTGVITAVDHTETYSAEAYYTHGPLALMAEYNIVSVDRDGLDDPSFQGGYVNASYFLTGEQREYKLNNGTYGRVKPKNPLTRDGSGYGAWEVAGRYTYLDLTDEGILGGEMDSYTLGVNWYPTSFTKFMLNYVINETDEDATTPNNDPHYLMLRAQVDF